MELSNSNLDITAIAYNGQIHLLQGQESQLLLSLAILLLVYILLVILAVQHLIIHPIHQLNETIENLDYKNNELHLQTNLKNEIGSITSHVNHMLDRISSLTSSDIESQQQIYRDGLNKKQTQIYAYQSQIQPTFSL